MQINRKTIGASSAVRLFVGNVWLTSVALRSSSENIRTSENLRELFNRYELTKNILLKIRRNSGGIPDSFHVLLCCLTTGGPDVEYD